MRKYLLFLGVLFCFFSVSFVSSANPNPYVIFSRLFDGVSTTNGPPVEPRMVGSVYLRHLGSTQEYLLKTVNVLRENRSVRWLSKKDSQKMITFSDYHGYFGHYYLVNERVSGYVLSDLFDFTQYRDSEVLKQIQSLPQVQPDFLPSMLLSRNLRLTFYQHETAENRELYCVVEYQTERLGQQTYLILDSFYPIEWAQIFEEKAKESILSIVNSLEK